MKRYVIKSARLDEVSTVDRPAQAGAVAVIMKRAEDPTKTLIKATFAEALKGELLEDKVREAFYTAFDNMYDGQCAFREALTDELAKGGDGTTAAAAYKQWLGSLVDQALGAAKQAGAAELAAAEIGKVFQKAATDWLNEQETDMLIIKNLAELKAAIAKAQGEGDNVTVATVTTIHKAATELNAEGELPAAGPLAKAAPAVDTGLAAKVERMEKVSALSTDLRKHYDALTTDAERDAFLAKGATEQAELLAKAAGDDPVIYTTLDGFDIRKSAGDAVLAALKSSDNARRELAKANALTAETLLEKRAGDELGNLGGGNPGKVALLKAVDAITDPATKEAALAVLKSANELAKGGNGSQRIGKSAGSTNVDEPQQTQGGYEPSDEEAKLDELAKAHAKSAGVSFEKAYSVVIQTPDGAALYRSIVDPA